jgi:hypothetical protein
MKTAPERRARLRRIAQRYGEHDLDFEESAESLAEDASRAARAAKRVHASGRSER